MWAVTWFLRYLRAIEFVAPAPGPVVPPLVSEFEIWMRQHRGSAERTLSDYRRHLLHFLPTMVAEGEQLDATVLRAYVIKRSRETTRVQMLAVVRALRMFVRFLVATSRCPSHLERAIPSVPHWRLATLPRYLPAADVERVLAACDPATVLGARDRAVLLLLARLALRGGDVRRLRLDDLDWSGGRLRVVGKLRRPTWLPLPQEVGDAIQHYLSSGRPRCSVAELFLCNQAPHRPLSQGAVGEIGRRAIARAGVDAVVKGSHIFRHSAATTLLRAGATLDDIGVLLRHASRDSTTVYAKVDVPRLLQIAQPWPEPLP